jgi:predicted outer membrane repeat protein
MAGGVATVLTISGANASGSIIQGLTVRNGRGPTTTNGTGAGVYVHDTSIMSVDNCIIRDNLVPALDGNGAGLAALNASVDLLNTRFENNSTGSVGSTGDGGALYVNAGDAWVRGCVFVGNSAGAAPQGLGGAVWLDSGQFTIAGCTFTGNSAASGGAVFIGANPPYPPKFESCRFSQNSAAYNGGAIYSSSVGCRLTNCLIDGNTSGSNGAAFVATDSLAAFNCTIAGNTGANSIWGGSTSASFDFLNTILWGNSPAVGTNNFYSSILQTGTVVQFGSQNLTSVDPLFVNAAAGDYHLQATSPAIDRGNTNNYQGLAVDLDAKPRQVEIPSVPNLGYSLYGPYIDIGAYEAQVPAACYANCDNSTIAPVLNVQDFACFLNKFAAGCSG